MRRKLLENETMIKKWGQLNLTTHRLWIESGDDDNYFLNSIELNKIQGHSILKYSNKFLLTLAVLSFFTSPVSVLLLKFASRAFPDLVDANAINLILLGCGLAFLIIGVNFFLKYQSSKSLTLNFQAGARNIYFRLSGEFARINDALDFSNVVDAQIHHLNVKGEEKLAEVHTDLERPRTFKIS